MASFWCNVSRRTLQVRAAPREDSAAVDAIEPGDCFAQSARYAVDAGTGLAVWSKLANPPGWVVGIDASCESVRGPEAGGGTESCYFTLAELPLRPLPMKASRSVAALPAFRVVLGEERVLGREKQIWVRVPPNQPGMSAHEGLDGEQDLWVCERSADAGTGGKLVLVSIAPDGPDEAHFYRNAVPPGLGVRVPVRPAPSFQAEATDALPPHRLFKGEVRVRNRDGQIWVKLQFPGLDDAWIIEHSCTTGQRVLQRAPDPTIGPGRHFYRNVYTKCALPVRAWAGLDGDVHSRLPVGMVFEASEREVNAFGELWVMCDGRGWAIERNARDGELILAAVEPPEVGFGAYQNANPDGDLEVMSCPCFGAPSKLVGELAKDEVFVARERRLTAAGEMWVRLGDGHPLLGNQFGEGWVPESVDGVSLTLVRLPGVLRDVPAEVLAEISPPPAPPSPQPPVVERSAPSPVSAALPVRAVDADAGAQPVSCAPSPGAVHRNADGSFETAVQGTATESVAAPQLAAASECTEAARGPSDTAMDSAAAGDILGQLDDFVDEALDEAPPPPPEPAARATPGVASAAAPPAPSLSPAAGTYWSCSPPTVSIQAPPPGAHVYYTSDGSRPTVASEVYDQPITIRTTTQILAVSVCGGVESEVVERVYAVRGAWSLAGSLLLAPLCCGPHSLPQCLPQCVRSCARARVLLALLLLVLLLQTFFACRIETHTPPAPPPALISRRRCVACLVRDSAPPLLLLCGSIAVQQTSWQCLRSRRPSRRDRR